MRFVPTVLAAAAVLLSAVSPAAADGGCTVVGAPGGDDRAPGTVERPLRTAQAVINRLNPGDTGCLRAGVYDDEVLGPYVANFSRSGRAGAPVTVRSFPGERARLRGVSIVGRDTHHVVIRDLSFDGRPVGRTDTPIGITILGADVTFADNDVTDPVANCLALGGSGDWGTARRPVVRGNRFFGCGVRGKLTNHAIYGNAVRGGEISGNVITGSSGYAINLHGDNRGLRIRRNVMVGNGGGVIFAGSGSRVSVGNVVTRNIIAGSLRRGGVSAWWSGRVGWGNRSTRNCMAGNRWDSNTENPGFVARGNVEADPSFVSTHDLRLRPESPCLAVVGADPARVLASAVVAAAG